jgi:deoxyhypusine synthase
MVKEVEIKGIQLGNKTSISSLVEGMDTFGLQATNLSKALTILRKMKKDKATVFLTFTSNMVSSGMREIFAQIAKEKLVDVIITTVGSIEEDFIKSEMPFLLGSFDLDDKELNKKDINRIGNILVPSDRYIWFEKKIQPILKEMYSEKKIWAPVDITRRMGEKLKDENSFLYWCAKNDIPVFCQAMLDGAFGLQVYMFKQDHKEFVIDDTAEEKLSQIVLTAEKTAAIVLGGGVAKHHTIGVNLLRGGLDYAIYINSTDPYDGSLSGARTNEAVSWNKINKEANHVSVQGDASILFTLLMAAYLEKK